MTLPCGWTETFPGGMATCPDPLYGGIVDSRMSDGLWFIVFHDDELDCLEGMSSREAAMAKFHECLNSVLADRMDQLSGLQGAPIQAAAGCLLELMVAQGGSTDADYSVARSKCRDLQALPFAEQIKAALDGGVSPDRLAQAIWGEAATWPSVQASYARPQHDIAIEWAKAGFQIANTGGDDWAAIATSDGVAFFICDYAQSRSPNPDYALSMTAYDALTGESLNFTDVVESLKDAQAKMAGWLESLRPTLQLGVLSPDQPSSVRFF